MTIWQENEQLEYDSRNEELIWWLVTLGQIPKVISNFFDNHFSIKEMNE